MTNDEMPGERDARERLQAALEAAEQEIDLLCRAMSHDVRAPLRAVDGFTRMLAERARERLTDEEHRWLDVVRASCARMGSLIEDLERYARLNRQPMRRTEVDMHSLARQAWSELPDTARARLEVSPLPPARGDRALLERVWSELLANACKFAAAGDGAHVEVSGERADGECVYRVRDRGVGFEMAYAGKLFAVFQRLHAATEFPGNGIGLANVARIVHRHGGRVGAEGAPRAGACFWFALPE